jgi:hypothetical protein
MEELQRGNEQNQHMHVHHVGWMYVALVVIAFAAVIGTGFGVYYLQQGQVESLEKALSEKNSMKVAASKEITSATTTATFSEQQIPYTFSYPVDWTKRYNAPIHVNPDTAQQKYSIGLSAPGTFITEEPIGGGHIRAGAQITVDVEPATQKAADEWVKTLPAAMKLNDRKDTTVTGIPAIEFRTAYESQDTFYTVFIKDGKLYRYTFVAGDGLQSSKYFQQYKSLLTSVKFK